MIFSSSISFPNMFSLSNGSTKLDTNYVSINRSIELILKSAIGELICSNYGSNSCYFTFENLTEDFKSFLVDAVVDSITKHESRITVTASDVTVNFIDNEKRVHITITYTLKDTNFKNSYEYDVVGGNY